MERFKKFIRKFKYYCKVYPLVILTIGFVILVTTGIYFIPTGFHNNDYKPYVPGKIDVILG